MKKLILAFTLGFMILGMTECLGSEFVLYGDSNSRKNNLTSPTYRSNAGGWTEMRLVGGNRKYAASMRPYLKLNMAYSSKDIPEENTASYGPGIEIRPLAFNQKLVSNGRLEWIARTRFYTEYLSQGFLKSGKPDWNPRHNFALGFDLWRRYPETSDEEATGRFWELYLGTAYHSTNFYTSEYDGVRAGLNLKVGKRYRTLTPYAVVDANSSSRRYFWENKLVGGIGVRADLGGSEGSGKFRVYAEAVRVIKYLQSPATGSDDVRNDVRFGISYDFNRY